MQSRYDEKINELIATAQKQFSNYYYPSNKYFGWQSSVETKGLAFTSSESKLINPTLVIDILIPYFTAHPELTALYFDEADLSIETIDALNRLIQSCNTLTSLKIMDFNPLGYGRIFSLKQAAKQHSVSLTLPYHYRDVNQGDDLIRRNKSKDPNTLDLSSSGCQNSCEWGGYMRIVSQDIIDCIIPHLQLNPNITRLILDKNTDITDGIIELVNAKTNIIELSVKNCSIKSVGMQALSKHGQFIKLDISGNYTTDSDLVAIVENNPQFYTLKVRYEVVNERQQFTEAVKVIATSKIAELDFDFHRLKAEQITYLAQSKTIKKLNLHNNCLTDKSLTLLATNKVITDLDLSSNGLLTDVGLYQFLLSNEALIKLNLKWIENVGDLTAVAIAKHPALKEVNLKQCKHISELGIRALAACQHLKKIKYQPYSWDRKFFPLLAEDDPQKATSLPQNFYNNQLNDHKNNRNAHKGESLDNFFNRVNRNEYNGLFKVPSLFSLAGYAAKRELIKKCCREYSLSTENTYSINYLIESMDPLRMKPKTIYIWNYDVNPCGQTYSNPGYQYQVLGKDKTVKRGIIYKRDLSFGDSYDYGTTQTLLPQLLKHIIAEGHISLFSEKDGQCIPSSVQEGLSHYKI